MGREMEDRVLSPNYFYFIYFILFYIFLQYVCCPLFTMSQDPEEMSYVRKGMFDIEQINYYHATGGPYGGKILKYQMPSKGRPFLIGDGRYCVPFDFFLERLKEGEYDE